MEFLEEAKATFRKISLVELDIEVTKSQTKQVTEFEAQFGSEIIIIMDSF
jgi:hypothetical protein